MPEAVAAPNTLRIAELFASIQGEGQWLGTPSTFVRVSGCNLRCHWCDTPYASWKPEGPVEDVEEIVRQVAARGLEHVVLTGGEPMLFDAIVPLAEALSARGHVITVETAGTVYRDLRCDLMSISPKLSHSVPPAESGWSERHDKLRLDFEVLRALTGKYLFQLKFVVGRRIEEDVDEIKAVVEEIGGVSPTRVMLMAEGRDAGALHALERHLVDVCMRDGWRLTPRYHIDLFGDVRGT